MQTIHGQKDGERGLKPKNCGSCSWQDWGLIAFKEPRVFCGLAVTRGMSENEAEVNDSGRPEWCPW